METVKTIRINNHDLAVVELIADNADKKVIVIFCHGYRSSSIGPGRCFVRTSRLLAEYGISSIRFDQFGSGNSEGDFKDSSFDDWVSTTQALVNSYNEQGYAVCLFGQSMGGSNVITAAAENDKVSAAVCWVPDPSIENFEYPKSGIIEEGGQIVDADYWKEAHDADIRAKLRRVNAPMYIVQCSQDEYVSAENHRAIVSNAQKHHIVEMFDGHKHSSWSHEQATAIIKKSVDFIVEIKNLPAS